MAPTWPSLWGLCGPAWPTQAPALEGGRRQFFPAADKPAERPTAASPSGRPQGPLSVGSIRCAETYRNRAARSGAGGMGVVYEVSHARFATAVIGPQADELRVRGRRGGPLSRLSVARPRGEPPTPAPTRNIVQVIDFDETDDGQPFPGDWSTSTGPTLARHLADRGTSLCAAGGAGHRPADRRCPGRLAHSRRGRAPRNLKPENVVLVKTRTGGPAFLGQAARISGLSKMSAPPAFRITQFEAQCSGTPRLHDTRAGRWVGPSDPYRTGPALTSTHSPPWIWEMLVGRPALFAWEVDARPCSTQIIHQPPPAAAGG